MFGKINKVERFVAIKDAKHNMLYHRISPRFYMNIRKAMLGDKEWNQVFDEASFDECIRFLKMDLYENGNVNSYAIEKMIEIISEEKGEKKFWLLVKATPFLQRRSDYGGWQYITQEAREVLMAIYWEIESAPNYSIFLWASDENNHRACGNIPFMKAINQKVRKLSGNKAFKIKYLKEGKKKFRMK